MLRLPCPILRNNCIALAINDHRTSTDWKLTPWDKYGIQIKNPMKMAKNGMVQLQTILCFYITVQDQFKHTTVSIKKVLCHTLKCKASECNFWVSKGEVYPIQNKDKCIHLFVYCSSVIYFATAEVGHE